MNDEKDLSAALAEWSDKFQPALKAWPAQMVPVSGSVIVSGRPNYVWISMPSGMIEAVFNARVAPASYLQVVVGYDPVNPSLLQVLSFLSVGGVIQGNTNIGPHADTHMIYGVGSGGGYDVVWVDARQFLPLKVTPAGALAISVYQTILWKSGGWALVSASSINLASAQPGTGARWVLVYLDQNGAIQTRNGVVVVTSYVTSLAISDIPALGSGERPLAAVKVYAGQAAIRDDATVHDILDLRFGYSTASPVDVDDAIALAILGW